MVFDYSYNEKDAITIPLRNSGINNLFAMIDGLPLLLTKKGKGAPWIRLTDVIEWHKKELEYIKSDEKRKERIELIELLIDKNNKLLKKHRGE